MNETAAQLSISSLDAESDTKSIPSQTVFLFVEIALVPIIAIVAIKALSLITSLRFGWLFAPAVLTAFALIPQIAARRKPPSFGLNITNIKKTLPLVLLISIILFPASFGALYLLNRLGFHLPLPTLTGHKWFIWIFYQFMYVAAAEELFFRGYLQTNIMKLTELINPRSNKWISITIASACFAIAHIVIQENLAAGLTFLPGLIFGWLFIRTKTLLAPILFHALANIFCLLLSAQIH